MPTDKTAPDEKNSESSTTRPSWVRTQFSTLNFTQIALLVLAVSYTLYFIRPVLLPVILALLLSLVLKPVHRFLCMLKIPASLGSIMIVISSLGIVTLGVYYLLAPAMNYADNLQDGAVKERLKGIIYPIAKIQNDISDVAVSVDNLTNPVENDDELLPSENTDSPVKSRQLEDNQLPSTPLGNKQKESLESKSPAPPKAVKVSLAQDPIDELFDSLKSLGYHLVITLTLVYFLLAYGEKMLRRITEVDNTAALLEEVTNEVAHYMFTITLINISLGIVIGLTMWGLGMPNPILWGTIAAALNFIPYLGAIVGTVIVFMVSATTYDNTFSIVLIPVTYYILTAIEGNLITPAILGRNFKINPIIVFLWVLCWGALWGIPGMLIGLPILMTTRIILARTTKFTRFERIISS
ncbi:MAG: AI-2E family transporter [Akkermansiaceae bacterium]